MRCEARHSGVEVDSEGTRNEGALPALLLGKITERPRLVEQRQNSVLQLCLYLATSDVLHCGEEMEIEHVLQNHIYPHFPFH